MINLYYDLTTGTVGGYADLPSLDQNPPSGQGVVSISDGTPFTDAHGCVSVSYDLASSQVITIGG